MPSVKTTATPPHPPQQYRTCGPLDLVVVCLLLCIGIAAIPVMEHSRRATVRVYRDSHAIAEFPLDEPQVFTVEGVDGPMEIHIAAGAASVHHSTCRRGICVRSAPIDRPGQQIVCVPNHVVVEIHANDTPEQPDAVAR